MANDIVNYQEAKYGQALIGALADELTKEYGKSFSKRNLQYFRKFYLAFPDEQIVNACVHNLNWSHFRAYYIKARAYNGAGYGAYSKVKQIKVK